MYAPTDPYTNLIPTTGIMLPIPTNIPRITGAENDNSDSWKKIE